MRGMFYLYANKIMNTIIRHERLTWEIQRVKQEFLKPKPQVNNNAY